MLQVTLPVAWGVAKGSTWYLAAAAEGVPRSYRVSRVTKATLLDEACQRPKDFDLAAYWEASTVSFKANLPRYEARLRVAAEVLPRLAFAAQGLGQILRVLRGFSGNRHRRVVGRLVCRAAGEAQV